MGLGPLSRGVAPQRRGVLEHNVVVLPRKWRGICCQWRRATRFVTIDRATPRWLPPDLRVWVPADHLAHFILDAVEALALRQVKRSRPTPPYCRTD